MPFKFLSKVRERPLLAEMIRGHFIVKIDEGRFLVDTGSPESFLFDSASHAGSLEPKSLAQIATEAQGFVGCEIAGVIGMDILGELDAIFSIHDRSLLLHKETISPLGSLVLHADSFKGLPVLESVRINGETMSVLWDTGAHLAYVADPNLLTGCHSRGPREDFHPFSTPSRFQVEAFSVPVEMGNSREQLFNEMAMLPAGVETGGWSILGSQLLELHDVHLSMRQGFISLRRRHSYRPDTSVVTSKQPHSVLYDLVGRTIKDVVVKRWGKKSPSEQFFLVFDDGNHFEIYSNESQSHTKGVDRGDTEHVLRYIQRQEHPDDVGD